MLAMAKSKRDRLLSYQPPIMCGFQGTPGPLPILAPRSTDSIAEKLVVTPKIGGFGGYCPGMRNPHPTLAFFPCRKR
jgi:hypothetical protein